MSRVRVGVVRRPESVDSSPGASRARAGDGRPGSGGNLPPHSQRVCDRDGSAEESGEVAGESGIHRRHAGSGQLAVAPLARRTEINGIARVGSAAAVRGRCPASLGGSTTVRGTSLDAKQLTYRDAVLYLGPPSAMTSSRLPASPRAT